MTLPEKPGDFEAWSAAEKARWIEEKLIGSTIYPDVGRPPLAPVNKRQMIAIAGRSRVLARTLDRTDDLMEPKRPKIIHPFGSVAMVALETLPTSEFSGVLAAPDVGGATGLVRLSLVTEPKGKFAVTPGLGIKLFVDGAPSLDLLAMNHTVGQGRDHNLFSNTFTHDLRNEHSELRAPQRALQVFFKKVTSEPRWLTIDHFAAVTARGEPVAKPRVPDRMVFRPHPDVRRTFQGRQGEDFRDTLARIEPGSILYNVEAVGFDGTSTTIGHLRTTSQFTSSHGGDRIFFRHVVHEPSRKL